MFKHLARAASASLIWVAMVASASAGDIGGAAKFVDSVAAQVLVVVKKPEAKDVQQAELMGLIDAKVDIDYVAKFVLGKYWRTATPEQRTDYVNAYKPFLKKNYVSRLTRYSGQTYKLGTGRIDTDGSYVIPMEIVDPGGQNVAMIYRVVDSSEGTYRISDIVVEGVSLLATQRSEFDSIAQSKGLDYLIDALKKRAAA